MGILQRMSMIFRAKADRALDRAEDPRETLDYSYNKQRELLVKVRRGVADVATSRKRIEVQLSQLTSQADKLQEQAQRALSLGREDLAREALTRRSGLETQMGDLKRRSSRWPPSGYKRRSRPSAPRRRPSRPATRLRRRRPGSARRSVGSPKR